MPSSSPSPSHGLCSHLRHLRHRLLLLPGTETCLKIGGKLEYDIHAASGFMGTNYGYGENLRGDFASDTWGKRARAASPWTPVRKPSWARCADTWSELRLHDPSRRRQLDRQRRQLRHRPCLHRAGRLPHRQDRLAVLDLHGLRGRHHRRRSGCSLRPVRHAPDRLHLHGRQRLLGRDRS